MKKIRLALAQINCTVGDLAGNARKIIEYAAKAKTFGADIVAFPELSVTGYPPEDLLLKSKFVADNIATLKRIAASIGDIVAIVGFVDKRGPHIYNAAALIHRGTVKGLYHKMKLPNYAVFDEMRYFTAGASAQVWSIGDVACGVNICEDIWHDAGPMKTQLGAGAGLIININASPYYMGKIKKREELIKGRARAGHAVIAYVNLIGGQDELVFDGQSMIVDATGKTVARAAAFTEELKVADIKVPAARKSLRTRPHKICGLPSAQKKELVNARDIPRLDTLAEAYMALTTGTRDYIAKNSFKKVVIGLSGGIDSSLVAAIATDALGKDNVIGVFMPTRYSSETSEADAKEVARRLGITFHTISIDHIYKIFLLTLEPHFTGTQRNIAEENLQARIRGTLLMALSNKFGWLVLTTGNKSEMATGYATLYGDMAGGFALIKDVPKMLVYKLAKYRNGISAVIPESVSRKEPTAELKANQKDRDTLPPYNLLDPILKLYVEEDKGLVDIEKNGCDRATAMKVIAMVDKSEYKRRQAPPGIKITPKAFGKDRRMPITNKYVLP